MLRPRIIPCLLVRNGGLVKTVRFGSPKYVGDPLNTVRIFNEKEVDELVVLDVGRDRGESGAGLPTDRTPCGRVSDAVVLWGRSPDR